MASTAAWKTAIEGARENLVNEYAAQGLDVKVEVVLQGRGLFHHVFINGMQTSIQTLPEVHAYLTAARRGASTVRWAIMEKQQQDAVNVERAIRQDRARERVIEVQQVPINTMNHGG